MEQNPPSVMILGTYHMANNNLDLIKTNYDDHLAPQRQAEIEEVLDLLGRYQPTHIAIERNFAKQEQIDIDYQNFLQDEFDLTANEIHLIGFQLAKRLGHTKLYCVDHNEVPSDVKLGLGEVISLGEDKGLSYIVDYLNSQNEKREDWGKLSVRDHLLKLNDAEFYENNHKIYIAISSIGNQPNDHAGADWVGMYWYTRNLKIYANLSHLAYNEAASRVLMIVGAGHLKLLTEFVENAPQLTLVSSYDYLK